MLFTLSLYSSKAFSQDATTPSIVKNDSWISARNNLNITVNLTPTVPIIDEITKLSFKIQSLNDSIPIQDLEAKTTITDHDGRLYKFENKFLPVTNGQFSVDYIFPDHGEHRIILQLYENMTPFTVSSFDLSIPHPTPPSQTDKILKPFTDFLDSIS
jgi:hypothetical protein